MMSHIVDLSIRGVGMNALQRVWEALFAPDAGTVPISGLRTYVGPFGTQPLTIVFTDIVGSTELHCRLGNRRMEDIKNAHFAVLDRLIVQFHGYRIKRTGDEVLAVFLNPLHALQFAWKAYVETGHPVVRIRAGLNYGPVMVGDDDISGNAVNIASWVMGTVAEHGIAISASVKDYIDQEFGEHDGLPGMVRFEGDLKGVGQAVYYHLATAAEDFLSWEY